MSRNLFTGVLPGATIVLNGIRFECRTAQRARRVREGYIDSTNARDIFPIK